MLVQYASPNTQESQFSLSPSIREFGNESAAAAISLCEAVISDAGQLLGGEPASGRAGESAPGKISIINP